jgi:hypothetical protein
MEGQTWTKKLEYRAGGTVSRMLTEWPALSMLLDTLFESDQDLGLYL